MQNNLSFNSFLLKKKETAKSGFTLVELIVVITILAILGTISFISLQGYSKSTRDSVRITDLSSMIKSLELYHIDTGKYPLTTDGYSVTYGGIDIWNQGIFGEQTFKNVSKLDRIPIDPLTDKEYTYSVLEDKQEYQLGGILEGDVLGVYYGLMKQVNAEEKSIEALILGNYNGETVKVNNTGTSCLVALPSIITSSGTTLESIVSNNYLVYNNYKNLPSNYKRNGKFKLLGESSLKLVNEENMELYCGNLDDLENNESLRLDYIDKFQKAYSGTQVSREGRIKEVLDLTIDKVNPSPELKIYAIELMETDYDLIISDSQKKSANSCNSNYHLESGICISNTKEVTVENGSGTQTWNGSDWGSTIISNCNSGYTNNGVSCIKNLWETGTYGSCSATSYWGGWGTCSASCGGGTQYRYCQTPSGTKTRTIICKDYEGTILSDGNCLDSKPITSVSCTADFSGCGGVSSQSTSCNTGSCCSWGYRTVCGSTYGCCTSGYGTCITNIDGVVLCDYGRTQCSTCGSCSSVYGCW